jgi:hypothetical protein
MLDKINVKYFLISFCIGILFVYCLKKPAQVVNKFPSPTNIDAVYKDGSHNCYKYEYKEAECTDTSIPQPIIEDFKKS